MDIRHLRYIVAVADEGTFTAAAARCFVAQPSLSQAVRLVERQLGADLFTRTGGTRLTPAGTAFVDAARLALRSFDRIGAEVEAVKGLAAGRIDVVALPTLALDPLADLVGRFRSAHPGVTVGVRHPESTTDLVEVLQRGDAEVGLTEHTSARVRHLVVHPLGRQEIVAVLPPDSRAGDEVDAAELARHRLVTQPPGTSLRALTDRFLERAGERPTIAVETDQRELIIPLVVGGAGAALLPAAAARHAVALGARTARLRPRQWRRIAVVHLPDALTPAGRAFVRLATRAGA